MKQEVAMRRRNNEKRRGRGKRRYKPILEYVVIVLKRYTAYTIKLIGYGGNSG